MTYEREKAFELEDGLVLNEVVQLVAGEGLPTGAFPSPEEGAQYIQSNGETWIYRSGKWSVVAKSAPEKLERVWVLPEWAQQTVTRPIECLNDDACFDIEGSLVFDDLRYALNEPGVPPVYPENFSYQVIPESVSKTVPDNQQMVVDGRIDIFGQLIVDGTVAIISDLDVFEDTEDPPDNFSWDKIPFGQTVAVPFHQQMFLDYPLDIEGTLDMQGRVSISSKDEIELPADNFSYRTIADNVLVKIPAFQDMLVADKLEILGTVDAEGSFTIFYF